MYEALGFKNKLKTFLGKELEYKDAYISANRLKDFKQYQVLDEKGNDIGSVVIEYRGDKTVILHPKLNISGKGYGKDLYKLISSKFNVEIQEWNEGGISKSDSAKAMWDSLEKEGSAKRVFDEEQGDNFRVVKYNTQITPQQKQQAQQLYSQYLEQNPNGSAEGFKNWVDGRNTFDKDLAQKIQDKLEKLYPEIKLNITNNPVWEQGDNIFNQEEYINQVNYRLKAVDILLSDKAKQIFGKGKKSNWDLSKILTELAIPKEQKQLLLDLGITDREQLVLELASKYGYSVEVNTAKESKNELRQSSDLVQDGFNDDGTPYYVNADEEYQTDPKPTQHYSNLTVPGGTNYTENEISTPLITPSIKGHAQFSTDNGIGWFRSDEQIYITTKQKEELSIYELDALQKQKGSIRRILELQSDLFQKGRGSKTLVETSTIGDKLDTLLNDLNNEAPYNGWSAEKLKEEQNKLIDKYTIPLDTNKNQFLQLLNKNSNWVTFFIKSIIQDSAKKGYEKVLFPKGETAAKIEGHQTIADRIVRFDDEIEKSKRELNNYKSQEVIKIESNGLTKYGISGTEKLFENEALAKEDLLENIKAAEWFVSENERKKAEYKSQGIEKLKPIEAFYEITVGNILEKQFGKDNVKTITDEYGNQWREITINQARDLANILLQKNEVNQIIGQANIKAGTVLIDAIKQKKDTLPHEYAHHYIAWFRNTPIVQEAIKKWGSEEALVQSIGEQVVKQKGEAYNWWNNFVKWIMNQFNSLSKLQKEELTQILTDAFLTRQDLGSKQDIEGFNKFVNNLEVQEDNKISYSLDDIANEIQYQLPQDREIEEFVASEKTIRDLAARMSDRIGIPVRFEADKTKKYKGKLESFHRGTGAVVNLAYATLDTPIHEILGHPIIRAIKNGKNGVEYSVYDFETEQIAKKAGATFNRITEDGEAIWSLPNNSQLYQNLLKELEYGKGKEVLDRIKRDYVYKYTREYHVIENNGKYYIYYKEPGDKYLGNSLKPDGSFSGMSFFSDSKEFISKEDAQNYIDVELKDFNKYTLEEQQEEAIVELLGLMTAEKLDKVKDGKLISLLKRLLKEMKAFMKQLLGQKEVEIDKLPDNMTLGDIADLLAYSNSKLILPGNEVVYTTPDNQQFKTYAEASKHISDLIKQISDVDLDSIIREFPKKLQRLKEVEEQIKNEGIMPNSPLYNKLMLEVAPTKLLLDFIEKNKQYEQSKEIIEEWKKVNNIQYNPEEVYSRGQEFVSVVGAYSDFDVNLMMQNLLQHIEDNQKAGGEFTISAFTKPIDSQINHLEGGGGKIKFKIYPQSQDIKWAANTDVYSGSVWDASKKVSKDKKSELLGVSYTKYPSLQSVNSVQPNLAAIIDDLAYPHNELGITLTGSNFRLEYDENIPYSTKKIINSINSILDQKYGKLVKPEINENKIDSEVFDEISRLELLKREDWSAPDWVDLFTKEDQERLDYLKSLTKSGIQPTQTNETLKESIESVSEKIGKDVYHIQLNSGIGKYVIYGSMGVRAFDENFNSEKEAQDFLDKKYPKKEYTEQALINTKIAKLKEVAKKYPRSLIRSEVNRINNNIYSDYNDDWLPFQKVSKLSPKQQLEQRLNKGVSWPIVKPQSRDARDNALIDLMFGVVRDKNTVGDMLTPGGFQYLSDIAEVIKTKRNIGTGSNRSIFDIMTVDELASRNTTGIALKGIAANHTSHASLRQHYNLQLANPIKFDGEELTSLSGKKASTEVILKGNVVKVLTGDNVTRTVTRNFGEVSAAVVDNAKDPVAYFLNYTTETSDIFSLLLGVGLDPYTASCFVSQPIVLEAIRLSEQSNKPLLTTMRSMLNKLDINPNKVKAVNLNTQELSDAVGTTNITTSLQTDVLKSYVAYSTPSRDLGKLIRASSADRKGLEASVASGEVILSLIDNILSDAKFSINGASEMLNITGKNDMIAEFTEQGIRKPISEILSQAFPFQAYVIARIKSIISSNIDNRELTEPEINYVNKRVINFLLTDFDYFKSSDRKELIDNLPERLSRLQSQVNSNPVIKEYAGKLLSVFQAKAGDKRVPDGMDIITFNTLGRLTDEQVDAIKQTWTDLLDLPEDIEGLRTFANDLIKYSFFTTGLGYSMNGYGHLIPTDAFTKYIVDSKGNTTSDHLEKAIEVCKNYTPYSEIIIPQFVDQFYRHEYNNQVYVPRVSTEVGSKNVSSIVKDVIMIKPGSVDVDNLYTTNYETEYTPEGERTTITYLPKPFIALQKGKITTLYKPTQDMFTGAITYAKTYKLGITGLTNEYDINGIGSSNVGNPYDDATATPNVVDNNTVIPTEKVAEDKRNECNFS